MIICADFVSQRKVFGDLALNLSCRYTDTETSVRHPFRHVFNASCRLIVV